MGIIGCFVVSIEGTVFRVVDVWNGDKKESSKVLLECINNDDSDFEWHPFEILKTMEVVSE